MNHAHPKDQFGCEDHNVLIIPGSRMKVMRHPLLCCGFNLLGDSNSWYHVGNVWVVSESFQVKKWN